MQRSNKQYAATVVGSILPDARRPPPSTSLPPLNYHAHSRLSAPRPPSAVPRPPPALARRRALPAPAATDAPVAPASARLPDKCKGDGGGRGVCNSDSGATTAAPIAAAWNPQQQLHNTRTNTRNLTASSNTGSGACPPGATPHCSAPPGTGAAAPAVSCRREGLGVPMHLVSACSAK